MPERFRVRLGDAELEVEGDRAYIEERLQWFLTHIAGNNARVRAARKDDQQKPSSPAEFIRQKRPSGGKETLLVLAYYLEHFEEMAAYTQQQVNDAAGRAKTKSIHSQYFTTAVKEGLLRNADRGAYALTLSGEDFVTALPRAAAD